MGFKKWKFNIKRKIAKKFFRDVMDSNSRKYLEYNRQPETGLRELYSLSKYRLLDELENKLKKGVTDKTLYDSFFTFYKATILYEYNSMHLELSNFFLETVTDFEKANNSLVDKEQIYFLRALIQITSSNTIGAMASWELASKERTRIAGTALSIVDLINNLPKNTILNPVDICYANNLLLKQLYIKNPTLFFEDFKTTASSLNTVDGISFLSCGLKNVQAINLIKAYSNSLHLNRIFAQEIINSLCIINESSIKDYPEVPVAIPSKKDRQIGKMLAPTCLGSINHTLSMLLGSSTGGYTGMYLMLSGIMSDTTFNVDFPNYINDLETNTYSDDELKARVLVGIHTLRNKVLHDIDDSLCYYNDAKLFEKTVGLLFAGVTVTKNLR